VPPTHSQPLRNTAVQIPCWPKRSGRRPCIDKNYAGPRWGYPFGPSFAWVPQKFERPDLQGSPHGAVRSACKTGPVSHACRRHFGCQQGTPPPNYANCHPDEPMAGPPFSDTVGIEGAWALQRNWSDGDRPSNAMMMIWTIASCSQRSQGGGSNITTDSLRCLHQGRGTMTRHQNEPLTSPTRLRNINACPTKYEVHPPQRRRSERRRMRTGG
jgi:hypothetical protein